MKCEKCEDFKDIFGNYVQCCKTGRFLNYEYWNNKDPYDCPIKSKEKEEVESNVFNQKTRRRFENCRSQTPCK